MTRVLNELLQWAVLVFLAIFGIGLTRQLGAFMTPGREQQTVLQGPALHRSVVPLLLTTDEAATFRGVMRGRGVHWGAIVSVSDGCAGCEQMLDHLSRAGMADSVPLAIIVRDELAPTADQRWREISDLVVTGSDRLEKARMEATPFTLLVDPEMRVVRKGIGAYPETLLEEWRSDDADGRSANDPPAGTPQVIQVEGVQK